MANLIHSMLQRDPTKRPNANQVLQHPIISDQLQRLLNSELFRDAFSYTLKHDQRALDEYAGLKMKEKGAVDLEEMTRKEEELEEQVQALKLDEYTPYYGQETELFNEMFITYVNKLLEDVSDTDIP